MSKSRVMLYFGSFNPIHKGHIALAEWVLESNLTNKLIFVVSPQNPLKDASILAPEFHRYQMCLQGCENSKYSDKIETTALEFTLPKPSYTINTLNWLQSKFGNEMEFSILMGADNIINISAWKDYEKILSQYHIFVYPRKGYTIEQLPQNVTYLADAPLFDCSSTQVRAAIKSGDNLNSILSEQTIKYIEDNKLYR